MLVTVCSGTPSRQGSKQWTIGLVPAAAADVAIGGPGGDAELLGDLARREDPLIELADCDDDGRREPKTPPGVSGRIEVRMTMRAGVYCDPRADCARPAADRVWP